MKRVVDEIEGQSIWVISQIIQLKTIQRKSNKHGNEDEDGLKRKGLVEFSLNVKIGCDDRSQALVQSLKPLEAGARLSICNLLFKLFGINRKQSQMASECNT